MKQIADIDKVMATLQKHNIFPIARIACFRDTPMAKTHPMGGPRRERQRLARSQRSRLAQSL